MHLEYTLNPRKIALFLGIISLYLAGQSLMGEYVLENMLGSESSDFVISVIDLSSVNAEATIPTWYSTLLLFVASGLLAFIAAVKQKNQESYRHHWTGLAFIFLYLSLDEGAVIHEIFSDPLQTAFNTSGYLAFAWQILFVPLLLLFVLVYLRFLFHLPLRIRNLFIIAGLFYVGGAMMVEAISANRWYVDGGLSFTYLAIATVEESLEMLGVVVFIFALLTYMVAFQYTAVVGFSANTQPTDFAVNGLGIKKSLSWAWWLIGAIVLIVGFNLALYTWALSQQSGQALVDPKTIPFYQTVTERYAGQGVIILGINEVFEADNPAAQPIATSLLTLFNDVMVVNLPTARSSIAFAGSDLPFDQNTLSKILRQSGEEEFVILDTLAIRAIAGNLAAPP